MKHRPMARLDHVSDQTYRLSFIDDAGRTTDIHEFSGRALCNGYDPRVADDLKIHTAWRVDYGRSVKFRSRLVKAVLQKDH